MKYLKHFLIVTVLAAGTVFASHVVWQGTDWIADGQLISASKTKDNFEYLYERSHDHNGVEDHSHENAGIFGGMFSRPSSYGRGDNTCSHTNPLTGACSCPAGFNQITLATGISGVEQFLFYCLKGFSETATPTPTPTPTPTGGSNYYDCGGENPPDGCSNLQEYGPNKGYYNGEPITPNNTPPV